ncbi:hypothetical protein TNCV_1407451 [Trichonephila clavipes]|nr:hypothetical protein TNCV_1407451 [Trichonephila clavipes]
MLKLPNPLIKNSSTQTDVNITKIKCSPLKLLEPFSSKPKPNASISTLMFPDYHLQPKPNSYYPPSSIPTAYSESQPPIPTSNDAPSTNDMFTPIGTSSQSYPLPRPTPLFNHPLHLIYRIPRKSQKSERENEKKEILKKK